MKKTIILFFVFLYTISLQAQILQLSDSAKVSLMTAASWDDAAYALFGHTALYVEDDSTNLDVVFNYGFFDPTQPYFIYNFMRGKTDYILGITNLNQFLQEYGKKRVEVVKQELNLTQSEKQKIWEALYINHLPENREYRYNYLFDNCVTRPRDLIEEYTEGNIIYPADKKTQTFRDLIHECVNSHPWMKFGIDLIVGSEADRAISLREKMFIPAYLMHSLDETTVVKNDSVSYPIVKSKELVIKEDKSEKKGREWSVFSPIYIAFALFLLSLLVSVHQYIKWSRTRLTKIYDTLLFSIVGIGGSILFFMMFFSEHPATGSNWNFVWMNFFALFFAILFWVKPAKKVVNIYHFINFVTLTLFLLFWWWIPQKMPLATIPFSMSLWIRSGMNVFISRRKTLSNKRYVSSRYMKAGWGQ